MNREALLEKRAQLVAACENHATVATPDAVRAFDLAEEEIRGIDAQLEGMAVRGRLDAIKAKNSQVVARPENRGGGNDAELARYFATRGREGSGNLELRTILASSVAATAGNTVPQSVMTGEFVKWLDWVDPIRQLATVQTVPAALRLPVIDSRTSVAATGESVTGTLAAYTESNFTTILKTFSAFKATAFTPVTEELLLDSEIDVAAEIVADHARAHGKYRAEKHTKGSGTGQEQGILYDDTSWQYSVKTGATNVAPDFDDIISLYTTVPNAYSRNGSWIMNQATWGALLQLKAATTGTYLYDGMQGMMLQDGAAGMLMGRPVYISEFADVYLSGTARNLIWFGDLARAYRIVDRKEVTFTVDPYSQSVNGITRFLSSMRSDAQIVDKRAGGVIINKAP
jgi:HK97 family phage major capsid protein